MDLQHKLNVSFLRQWAGAWLPALLACVLFCPLQALAQGSSTPGGQTTESIQDMEEVRGASEQMLSYISTNFFAQLDSTNPQGPLAAIKDFSNALVTFFIVLLILPLLTSFVFEGPNWIKIFDVFILIAIVLILRSSYNDWTDGLYNVAKELGASIQEETICTRDALAVVDVLEASTLRGSSQTPGFSGFISEQIMQATSAVAMIFMLWGLWMFAAAKIIGWFFIPFLLFEKLGFLFKQWFQMLLSSLVYIAIVRVVAVLVTVAFATFSGILPFNAAANVGPLCNLSGAGAFSNEVVLTTVTDPNWLAQIVMPIMALMAFLATSHFASSIAGGMSSFSDAFGKITKPVTAIVAAIPVVGIVAGAAGGAKKMAEGFAKKAGGNTGKGGPKGSGGGQGSGGGKGGKGSGGGKGK